MCPCWKLNPFSKSKKQRLEVLHLFRCFTHTPRCREAILCNECTDCRKALICSLRQDISMKSKCRERHAIELAGLLSIGRRFASHVAANHRYLISLPCPGPAGLGFATYVPNGWQGEICRRENLDWTGTQVVLWILELLKDRCIGFPVTVENVVEDCSQLVNLTWNR